MAELKECAHLVESVAEYLDSKCRIWKETLDRAYKDGKYNHNTGLWETDECKVSRARYTLDAYRDALSRVDTLGQQIDELNGRPSPSTESLTLEELRKMDGEPVWVVPLTPMIDEFKPHWCIMRSEATAMSETSKGKMWFLHLCDYGKTWLAYRRKPKKEV